MSAPALEINDLTKSFGPVRAVDAVSFSVDRGQIHGFIGPNGAGKTTTMRICATLELPDTGDVRVDGWSVLEDPRMVRRRLGFMPDAFGSYSNTTVRDYLDFFARAYGLHGARRRAMIEQVMDFTALHPLAWKETRSLSKGMKQRLCLAKTLLHDPRTLILDEPAAGLDPRARVELRELVRALAGLGKAVLVSSHILTELAEMCDGIAVIEQGRIRATGTVGEIRRRLEPHTRIHVKALAPAEAVERVLLEQPGVERVVHQHEGLTFDATGDAHQTAALLAALVRAGVEPIEFSPEDVDLEDIFLSLTEGKLQ